MVPKEDHQGGLRHRGQEAVVARDDAASQRIPLGAAQQMPDTGGHRNQHWIAHRSRRGDQPQAVVGAEAGQPSADIGAVAGIAVARKVFYSHG